MKRPSNLVRRFMDLNECYFHGRVPQGLIQSTPSLSLGAVDCYGMCDLETKAIHLRRGLHGDLLQAVLLHEMIHALTGEDHDGERFRAEESRLRPFGVWAPFDQIKERLVARQLDRNIRLELRRLRRRTPVRRRPNIALGGEL